MHETRIASFGAVASVVGSGAMFTDGFLKASAVLLVVGVLASIAGLYFAGVKVKPSSSTTKRVATIAVVGLVITTAALSGAGGPASPVGTVEAGFFEGCGISDSLSLSIASSLGLSNQDCAFWTPDGDRTDAVDAYSGAVQTTQTSKSYLTAQENMNQDRVSVAVIKAKIVMVEEMNANASKSDVKNATTEAVRDYYATPERNLINQWNAWVASYGYSENVSAGTMQLKASGGGELAWNGTTEKTYTLVNGSTMNVTKVSNDDAGTTTGPQNTDWKLQQIDPADDSVSDAVVINRTKALLNEYDSQAQQATDNINSTVEGVYSAYQAGEIDSSDLAAADPTTMGAEASTDLNSTGYYGYANAQLAALGLDGNNTVSHVVETTYVSESVNDTGAVTTTSESVNITGGLYFTSDEIGTLETGTTYDPANLTGTVYMTVSSMKRTSDGNTTGPQSGFVEVTEPFTIQEATDTQTGESVQNTTVTVRNYNTTDLTVEELKTELEQLKEDRAYYESQQSSGGGISLDLGGVETGVILALLAVAFLATRD